MMVGVVVRNAIILCLTKKSRLIKHNEFCLYKSIFYVNKKQKIPNQNIIDEVKSIASVS